ncbi:protein CREG1-like [Salvia divinorum]|uniref:Protein CREG1-like n=1 Tax=Salvia divinorum TaxID=28513 RepID=A0ABD1HZ47_SALDI
MAPSLSLVFVFVLGTTFTPTTTLATSSITPTIATSYITPTIATSTITPTTATPTTATPSITPTIATPSITLTAAITTATPSVTPTTTSGSRVDLSDRPDVEDAARYARWLVGKATWGVLSTNTPDFFPFGYPASYVDAGTGYPYFFLSRFDPVGAAAKTDARVSLAISEVYIDGCDGLDTQSPKCPKITLSGRLRKVPAKTREGVRAESALLKAHPGFAGFPKTNGSFAVYKLDILRLFLVNQSGPKRDLTVESYLYVE